MADEMVLLGKVLEIKRKDKAPEKEGKDWTLFQMKIADHQTGATNQYGWFSTKGGDLKENHSYEFRWRMDGDYRNITSMVQEIETPAGSPAATASPADGGNGFGRSKEEMRWTASLEMATSAVLTMGVASENSGQLRPTIVDWAEWYYEVLLAAPAPVEEELPVPAPASDPTPVKTKAPAKSKDLKPEGGGPPDMEEDTLRDVVAEAGMDWTSFEDKVLGKPWEEFIIFDGATVQVAYNRFKNWREKNLQGARS